LADASRRLGGIEHLRGPILSLITGVIYWAVAAPSLAVLLKPAGVAAIWPANAIIIAMMARLNRRQWTWALLGEAVGCLAAHLTARAPAASLFGHVFANGVETLLTSAILTRWGSERPDFHSLRRYFRLMIAVAAGSALGAAIIVVINVHTTSRADATTSWQALTVTHALGILVVVPVLLLSHGPAPRDVTFRPSIAEVSSLFGLFALVVGVLFCRNWPPGAFVLNRPLLLTLPFLLWVSLRTNPFITSIATLILSGIAVTATFLGHGPFVPSYVTVARAAIVLELTLLAWTATSLIISIVTADHRRALQAVSRERERFRQLADNIDEVFWMADAGTDETLYISPAYERVWGRSCQSLMDNPRSFIDAIHPEDRPRVVRHLPIQTTGVPFETEYRIIRPDGSIRWIHDRGSPVRDAAGQVKRYVGVAQDITERKRGEELLHQSLDRFQVLAAASFEGIVIHENERILDCNEQFAAIYGYERTELIGSPIAQLIAQADKQSIFARIAEERELNVAYTAVRKNGSTFAAESRGRTISHGGRSVRIVAVRDITERVRMREIATQSEKMLSIGGLAAGLAHEINNPLAVMMQNAETVLRRVRSDSPRDRAAAGKSGTTIDAIRAYMKDQEILDMLESITRSGERAASITKNMLAFSQPRSSAMRVHHLDALINQTIELARNDPAMKKIFQSVPMEIETEFDTNLPPLPCHGSEVQQVLLNLLKNASQASVGVVSPRIVIRARRENEWARIEVEDNGTGMPESVRQRIFEPFFTTKPPGEGMGLGLFVSYFIITHHHQGTICVNSNEGGGTRFDLMLPLQSAGGEEEILMSK
jgi:PAS domain S-box-containing protein